MQKLLFFTLFLAAVACSNGASQKQKLDADAFDQMLKADKTVQLVDVRTPDEFAQGHIPNAVNIDYYSSDFATRIGALDKSRPVLVYCASGSRSASAAGKMNKMGFDKVYDLAGGIGFWAASGKPVTN